MRNIFHFSKSADFLSENLAIIWKNRTCICAGKLL
jgi:hypothetical protein